jgi:hypothetical protein
MNKVSVFIIGVVIGMTSMYFTCEYLFQEIREHHVENSMKTLAKINKFHNEIIEEIDAGNVEKALNRLKKMAVVEKELVERCIAENCASGVTDELRTTIKP